MKQITNHFTAFIFCIFIYSGMLKWIPLPFDLTIASATILVITLVLRLFDTKSISKIILNRIIVIFVLMIIWTTISLLYSGSNEFCYKKLSQFYLCLVGILVGISYYEELFIKLFLFYNRVFLCICLLLLTYTYFAFGYSLSTYIYFASAGEDAFPNYLILSAYLATNIFLIYNKNSLPYLLLKLWTFFMLINLGGRGPILFLVLITFSDTFLFNLKMKKVISTIPLIIIVIFTLVFTIDSFKSNRSIKRFLALGGSNDRSSKERINLMNKSIISYSKSPILGIGIGAFGNELYDREIREYPHSMFLEVLCELGIIGIILFIALLVNLFAAMINLFRKHNNENPYVKCIIYALLYLILEGQKSGSVFENRILFSFIGIFLSINYFTVNKVQKIQSVNE